MIEESYPTVPPPTRRRLPRDLGPRVLVAVPALAVVLALNHVGGAAFAAALAVLGLLGAAEAVRLARRAHPAAPGAAALLAAVAIGWLALCLAHAVLLRERPHGAGLVIAVMLATFVGDTAAQLAGTAFGRRRLSPRISPNKSVEGLVAGIVAGTAACALLAAFEPWLTWSEALALGAACALAAPAGDLLESAFKRRAGVKDSGRLFGAHGGVLDRVDAVAAAALVGYYVSAAAI